MAHLIIERTCKYCGKSFIPAPYHQYKCVDENGESLFCKYTCQLHYERRRNEQRAAKRKKAVKHTEDK